MFQRRSAAQRRSESVATRLSNPDRLSATRRSTAARGFDRPPMSARRAWRARFSDEDMATR
jgi:hypothetical protein